MICYNSNQVICVSQSNKDTGYDVFGLKSARVIENGVNLDRFSPDSQFVNLRQEFGFFESDFVVGFIARCTKQKSPLTFLESLIKAHEANSLVKGLFIGEGDMDGEVDAFIQKHQMQGYVYRSPFRTDVPDLLHCIDVYCLPSLWEGLSIALLEAMAMRKAIIATPTDGTKEVIQHEKNGIVVPFNDVSALANAISVYYADRELMDNCSKQARKYIAERFNAKRVAESVSAIYSELLF